MFHFRDRGGDFYLITSAQGVSRGSTPPFMRFAMQHGRALDLEDPPRVTFDDLLAAAQLDWSVDQRPVLTPFSDGPLIKVKHYKALVRPAPSQAQSSFERNAGTDEPVMSVVTTAYSVAENDWVAAAAVALARQYDSTAAPVAAAGFGRTNERTMFAVRITASRHDALVLLVYNQHGGEGAVRFQIVQADQVSGSVLTPDTKYASFSVPHIGDVRERLERLSHRKLVEQYVAETVPLWESFQERLWTPRHTKVLLGELWRGPAKRNRSTREGWPLEHPSHHLTYGLRDCTDAASAYRRICDFLDNESEACERGDFTKDRAERLALGAGTRLKQQAWRWIVANT